MFERVTDYKLFKIGINKNASSVYLRGLGGMIVILPTLIQFPQDLT